jgi:hypothetical protein
MEYQEGSYEVEGDGYGLPDAPHLEIMFDALETTGEQNIDGMENFTLTQAQRYAQGVLHAAGIVTNAQVTGTEEGVFSAIGGAFKAVWDYIVKTFKAIWDFFFGRDNEKEAEEAKDAIGENNDELKKAENGTQTEAEADAQLSKMATAAGGEEGDEALAKTLAEAKKGDLKAKRAAIKAALKELPKLAKKQRQKVQTVVDQAVKAKMALIQAAGKDDKKTEAAQDHLMKGAGEGYDLLSDLINETGKTVAKEANFIVALKNSHTINTVQGVLAFGTQSQANIDVLKALGVTFKAKKSKVEGLIKTAETNMKKAKDAKDKAALKKELDALRAVVNMAVRISKLMEISYHRVQVAHTELCKVFGM